MAVVSDPVPWDAAWQTGGQDRLAWMVESRDIVERAGASECGRSPLASSSGDEVQGVGDDTWQLEGAWIYGSTAKPSTYHISWTDGCELRVDERLNTGVSIFGVLQKQGPWLQAGLMSADGKRLGSMRLRMLEGREEVLSNIRGPGATKWGRDIVARRAHAAEAAGAVRARRPLGVVVVPRVEANAAAEMLSKFFDSMEATHTSASSSAPTPSVSGKKPDATAGAPVTARLAAATAAAAAAAEPASIGAAVLEGFGCSICRLEYAGPGRGLVCSEGASVGMPLLVLPLTACWSKAAAAQERPEIARAMSHAAARNSRSKVLTSDATWIIIHLLYERGLGAEATPARRSHLELLTTRPLETTLVWSDRELDNLRSSRWYDIAMQRRRQMSADFRALASELGSEVLVKLGLDEAGYAWARAVLEEFGCSARVADGSTLDFLLPGLELMDHRPDLLPNAEGIRVEVTTQSVVVYATQDYTKGDSCWLSHGGLASSNGSRLLACGRLLESNPWEHVEVVLRLPVAREHLAPEANFWRVLSGIEEGLKQRRADLRVGSCLPCDTADMEAPVRVVEGKSGPEVQVHIRLSRGQLLPDRGALLNLGLLILAHTKRMEKVLKEEKGVLNPLGPHACERRALDYLKRRLIWRSEEYPSKPDGMLAGLLASRPGQDDESVGGSPPRRARGVRVVAEEKRLLEEAVAAITAWFEAPEESEPMLQIPNGPSGAVASELAALGMDEEPDESSELGRAVAQLRGCTRALELLGDKFRDCIIKGDVQERTGKALNDELRTMWQLLNASPLGSAMVEDSLVMVQDTQDAVLIAHQDAFLAGMSGSLAGLEWTARLNEQCYTSEGTAENKDRWSRAVADVARARMRLREFKAALEDLQRSLVLTPDPQASVLRLARECLAKVAAARDCVLRPHEGEGLTAWKSEAAVLRELRTNLKAAGYMKAVLRLPCPPRLPCVQNLASYVQALWDGGVVAVSDAQPMGRTFRHERTSRQLHGLVDLLLLRRTLPLSRASALLGQEALACLLSCSALSCILPEEARLLSSAEASAALAEFGAQGMKREPEVISNVAFWPVDEDVLVVCDFDQHWQQADRFEPVPAPSQGTRALLEAAPRERLQGAGRVLDAHCGSGAQGFMALKRGTEQCTFLDPSPRALRFARFGAVLNGVEGGAKFEQGSLSDHDTVAALGAPFDAVLLDGSFLPNPEGVASCNGSAYVHGGVDGEHALLVLCGTLNKLLVSGGWLLATVLVHDGVARRLEGAVDISGRVGCTGILWRGTRMATHEFVLAATPGLTELQRACYTRGLYHRTGVRALTEAMCLLVVASHEAVTARTSRVDVQVERKGLWGDEGFVVLRRDVAEALHSISTIGNEEVDEPLYAFEWSEGCSADFPEQQSTPSTLCIAGDGSQISPWRSPRSNLAKALGTSRGKEHETAFEGATWSDIMNVRVLGFSPPALCDATWHQVPAALAGDGKLVPKVYNTKPTPSKFRPVALELHGCRCPQQLKDVLRKMGAMDRMSFEGGTLRMHRGDLISSGAGAGDTMHTLSEHDVLLVPLLGRHGTARGPSISDMAGEVLQMLQLVFAKAAKRKHKVTRMAFLSACSVGPNPTSNHGYAVPVAAPVLALVRSARVEFPLVPLLWIDTDALSTTGGGEALLEQLCCELDLATPAEGFWQVSSKQQAMALLANNRDVAYRHGQRWLPKLELSPRMPIYIGRPTPDLPRAVAEGVALVTGGTGGVGFLAAEALVEVGIRCLVLASRAGELARDQGIEAKVEEWQDRGITVLAEKCDVAQDADVQRLIARVRAAHGPLTVVVHASGLTDDRPFAEQDSTSMQRVFEPKAMGAWLLHRRTLDDSDSIQAFIMFSSVAASQGGSGGQAACAVASAYLDELARLRVASGLPAVSVQWPALDLTASSEDSGTGGRAVRAGTVKQVVKQLVCGIGPLAPVQAVLPSGYLTGVSPPVVASMLEPLTAGLRQVWDDNS